MLRKTRLHCWLPEAPWVSETEPPWAACFNCATPGLGGQGSGLCGLLLSSSEMQRHSAWSQPTAQGLPIPPCLTRLVVANELWALAWKATLLAPFWTLLSTVYSRPSARSQGHSRGARGPRGPFVLRHVSGARAKLHSQPPYLRLPYRGLQPTGKSQDSEKNLVSVLNRLFSPPETVGWNNCPHSIYTEWGSRHLEMT